MKTKFFILTNSANGVPQKLHETESVLLSTIKKRFEFGGFEVIQIDFESFINGLEIFDESIYGSYFFYASSQYTEYKDSINDILVYVKSRGGRLIPEYEHFVAHENKFYQILASRRMKLRMPQTILVNTNEKLPLLLSDLVYPQIAKLSSGHGGNAVHMVHNFDQACKFIDDSFTDTVPRRRNFIKRRKQLKRFQGRYPLKHGKVLFQEYLIGVDHDWKVLVFGKKLFALKRFFRPNDFRASGSGDFEQSAVPDENLLEFAYETSKKINTPFVSLDVIETNSGYYLLEYQCMHFGLMAAMYADHHFENYDGTRFEIKKNATDIDSLLAESLFTFIQEKSQ